MSPVITGILRLTQARRLAKHVAEELDPAVSRRRMLACDAQPGGLISDVSCSRSSAAADPTAKINAQVDRTGSDQWTTDSQRATQLSEVAQQLAALTQAIHLMGGRIVYQLPSERASSR